MQQITIIRQIVILVILALVGFISGKKKHLPENSGVVLSKFVVKVTLPSLIFTTLTGYDFSKQEIIDGCIVYICGLVFILFSFVIAKLISDRLKIDDAQKSIYKMLSTFGNIAYMGFPLLESLYGNRGLIYAIFFQLANDTLLWTLGIYLVNRQNTKSWRDNIKHLFNINTLAFAIGIVAIAVNFQELTRRFGLLGTVYKMVFDALNPLGKSTTYISMIFIGLILSKATFRSVSDIFKKYSIFIFSFVKLLVIPVVAYIVLQFAGRNLDPLVLNVIVLQLAMPAGTIVSALTAEYNSDYQYATEGVFISTVLSVITLPLLLFILK
ncbi:MAG TPA: AEC family transporter [Clostridiaceae bacterium]|nr:AEC family transporter [Clostridiaceae bacterium]